MSTRTLLDEALNLLGSMISALTYGVALALYCICTHTLCRRLRKPAQRKGAQVTLAYTTFAIICGTFFLGLMHYVLEIAYIFHPDFRPGGPVMYEVLVLEEQPPFIAAIVFMAMLDWLTLGIQIWRLWILWRANRCFIIVITLPAVLFLACIGVGIASVVPGNYTSLSEYNYFISLAFYGIPPVTTIIVTTLIISRLVMIRRRHTETMGDTEGLTNQYTGIIAMVTESYALDAIWSVATVVTFALWKSLGLVAAIFIQASVNIKVISLFLIVYRVARGRAWNTNTEQQLSSLRWNPGIHSSTSDPIRDALSRIE